jgi:hypothetical protein
MTRWSRPKSETPSARHTLARDAYAIHYGHIRNIVQALDNDQFDWLCASAARINCESIAEYLTELVRDAYEEAAHARAAAAARAAATNRIRRKLEILKLNASKSRGQLFHDLQECQALMDIIAKGEENQ